jgi:hypothetical protein
MAAQAFIALESPRFRWLVRRLHGLGPRVVGELLAEIGGAHLIRLDIERRLEAYAALDPAVLAALGADRFPSWPPLRVVTWGRNC